MKYCDPRYDVTFKKVFGEHSDLLISFLNAMLPLTGDQVIESIEYLTPELIPEFPNAKYSIVDVQCTDKAGRKFLVEMQMVWSEEFKARVLFNASKAYVSQLGIGQKYKLLQPVYSLNIVNDVFETDLPEDEYYHYYQLVHEKHSDKIIEGLHIAFVELPKFKPTNAMEQKMRNLWLRFLTEINEKTRSVPTELMENPMTSKAVLLMEEAGMSEAERYAYEKSFDNVWVEQIIMREMRRRGLKEGLEKGLEKGIEKGIEKGRAQGIAQGIAQGMTQGIAKGKELGSAEALLKVAHIMLDLGIDTETIRKVTGLSDSELEGVKDSTNQAGSMTYRSSY